MMEAPSSLAYTKTQSNPPRIVCLFSPSLISFHSSQISIPSHSFTSLSCKHSSTTKQPLIQFRPGGHLTRRKRIPQPVNATETLSTSSEDSEKWVLQPVGDGDSRHIGYKVAMPNAFEIDSSVMTVGRLPEKADMVISVATVSGLHARIKKKVGCLLVTDLGSTNGTYVNGKRIKSGEIAKVSPGSLITFGDTNLAMFRVIKMENVDLPSEPEDSEVKSEPGVPVDVS